MAGRMLYRVSERVVWVVPAASGCSALVESSTSPRSLRALAAEVPQPTDTGLEPGV